MDNGRDRRYALPPGVSIGARGTGAGASTLLGEAYPVLGLISPLSVLARMERFRDPNVNTISIGTSPSYSRFDEPLDVVERLVHLVEDSIEEPARGTTMGRFEKMRKLAARWSGEQNADRVFDAFLQMDEAFRLKQAAAPRYSSLYCGVSMRQITRPLLIRPDLLTKDEEAYFLPYVFNIHESEARNDYIDLHGDRIWGPGEWKDRGLEQALQSAARAAGTLESLKGAREEKWFRQLATSLRMWASGVRTMHNFYSAQMVRDQNSALLSGPPQIPPKVLTWFGHPDFID